MFKNPFSFGGRIRRTEYGLSIIISMIGYFLAIFLTAFLAKISNTDATGVGLLFWIFYIPIAWFNLAQNTKRCHDLGNSGWYQLIPLYGFWLLFAEGNTGANEYGHNPKAIGNYEELSEIGNAS